MNDEVGQGRRIALVGAGLIGSAWAVVFARAGCAVSLHDAKSDQLAAAVVEVDRMLDELQQASLLDEPPHTVRRRIVVVPSLVDAVRGAVHVQESVSEDVEVKRRVFAELDALTPPATVLASSTSGIPTSAWSKALVGRDRCLVAHPINPPHLVPLVELSGAPWTSADALERTRELMSDVRQMPIVVRKETEGFVLNRLQGALLREAFELYREGVASVADIDAAVRDGLSPRWSFMGPFETIDLNAPQGIADYCARYGPMYARMAHAKSAAEWSADLVARIEAERRAQIPAPALSQRRRWRDAQLALFARARRGTVSR